MDLNSALDIIISDLRDARKIIDDLKNVKGVSIIQVELAKAKCKSAEEIIELLKTIERVPVIMPTAEPETAAATEEPVKAAAKDLDLTLVPPPVPKPDEKKSSKGKPILADRYGQPADRINERMSGNRAENDISAKIKQSPISNLAEAIGVNDRFFYIREVFGGNKEAYHSAMEKLNSASDSGEAEDIIRGYSAGDGDPAALKSLLDLVRRKTGFNG